MEKEATKRSNNGGTRHVNSSRLIIIGSLLIVCYIGALLLENGNGYQEACAESNFDYAYKESARMKNEIEEMRQDLITPRKKRIAAEEELDKTRKYVYDHECLFLLGMKDKETQKTAFVSLKGEQV